MSPVSFFGIASLLFMTILSKAPRLPLVPELNGDNNNNNHNQQNHHLHQASDGGWGMSVHGGHGLAWLVSRHAYLDYVRRQEQLRFNRYILGVPMLHNYWGHIAH